MTETTHTTQPAARAIRHWLCAAPIGKAGPVQWLAWSSSMDTIVATCAAMNARDQRYRYWPQSRIEAITPQRPETRR